jgi:predicted metal-dependent HD superfamily phosphohydrolase
MLNDSRFSALWQRLGGRGDGRALFAELERAHSEPQRAYHTTAHIEDCLTQFDLARHLAKRPDEVEAAIWFHDAVYDPRASDNEERSAEWARKSLIEAGAADDIAQRIAALVLLTRHVDPPTSRDGELLLDIDLSILGRQPDMFAVYDVQIRQEYNWVPEAEYRRRRADVLAGFLGQPTIYRTEFFRKRLESQARENLSRVIFALHCKKDEGR